MTYVAQLRIFLMEQQEWLPIFHGGRILFDHVVGMAVGQDQIDTPVVVVVEELQSLAA